jgi:hypothetical protein
MKAILSERNLVIVLFVMVFITFSLAHEDSKKMEKAYTGINSSAISHFHLSGMQPPKIVTDQTPFVSE